jgi:hypothetical protein
MSIYETKNFVLIKNAREVETYHSDNKNANAPAFLFREEEKNPEPDKR